MYISFTLNKWKSETKEDDVMNLMKKSNVLLSLNNKENKIFGFHPNNIYGIYIACEQSLINNKDCLILNSDFILNENFSTKKFSFLLKNWDFLYSTNPEVFVIKNFVCKHIYEYYSQNNISNFDKSLLSFTDVVLKNKKIKSNALILN